MKAHVIENGVVINTVLVNSLDDMPNLVEATKGSIGWLYKDGEFSDPNPPSREEILAKARKQIKGRRDKALNAGTTVGGVAVATDDLTQQRITGAALAATVDPNTTAQWKLEDDTFITLDATQIIGIAQGIRAHVQACFDREAELLAALNAGQSYDINAGWPVKPE